MAKCGAIHGIINSNCVLSILKYIESSFQHWVSFSFHAHTHTRYILLLNHCLFISLTTLYFTVTLPSSFSLFYNLTLLLRILFVHTYDYTSSNLSLPSLPLPLPLPSTSLLNFLYPFLFSITWLFFFPFYLCKFDIISSIQSIFFLHKNCEYSLSLSTFF